MKLPAAPSWPLCFFAFLQLIQIASSLYCIQCDRREAWYSPEENEKHIQRCQKGEIAPTKCANASHTHCIYSYYRKGGDPGVTIMERKCGIAQDMIGCTLFKSNPNLRKVRHLLSGSTVTEAKGASSHRRRETALYVEVCTEGCEGDGCINSAPLLSPYMPWLFVVGSLWLLQRHL